MVSRSLVSRIVGVVVLALVAATVWRWWPSVPPSPGVVLITIDTLRADRVGVYGSRAVRTPALDRLASEGLRFDAAYATVPLTLPSHVSILSGRLPVEHSVRTNDGYQVPDGVPLVAEALRGAGYRTAAFVGSAVLRASTGLARGFERFDDATGTSGERRGAEVVERAGRWLGDVGTEPFFLWVHLYDPHLPYDAPEPFASEYAGRAYDAEVAYADHCVGALLARLDEAGLWRRTTVIAVADHGEGLGDHGERSHGVLLYDSTLRVPLLIRRAGRAAPATTIARPVSTAQVGPTVLALAGFPRGGVLPDLFQESGASDPVPAETLYLAQQLGWSPMYAARIGRFKVIDAPSPQLYDLEADPGEHHDLAAAEPGTVTGLRDRLRRELEAAAQRASKPSAAAADAEVSGQLAALGYVSGGGIVTGVPPVGGADPAARLSVWEQVERGLELAGRDRHEDAGAAFESVLRDDPDNVLALKFLGAASLERGDLAHAIDYNQRVVASGLHRADALSNLALAYYRAGRLEAALDTARRAVEADGRHRPARANLALVLQDIGAREARSGNMTGAITAFREAAAVEPANLDAAERLAAALHRAGRDDEARSRFEAIIAAASDRPAPHLSLAILDLDRGRAADAAARLERIRRGWPGAYRADFHLGEAYRRLGDSARARDAYAACVAAAPPDDPIVPVARRALAALK